MAGEYEQMRAKAQVGGVYEVKEEKKSVKKVVLMPGVKRSRNLMENAEKCPILYKYKEGCIMGIRRNVNFDFFFK